MVAHDPAFQVFSLRWSITSQDETFFSIFIPMTLGVSLSSELTLILEMLLACDASAKRKSWNNAYIVRKATFLKSAWIFASLLMMFAHVLLLFSMTTLGSPIKHVRGSFTSSSRLRLQRHTAPQAFCSLPARTPAFEGSLFSDLSLWILLHDHDLFKSL